MCTRLAASFFDSSASFLTFIISSGVGGLSVVILFMVSLPRLCLLCLSRK